MTWLEIWGCPWQPNLGSRVPLRDLWLPLTATTFPLFLYIYGNNSNQKFHRTSTEIKAPKHHSIRQSHKICLLKRGAMLSKLMLGHNFLKTIWSLRCTKKPPTKTSFSLRVTAHFYGIFQTFYWLVLKKFCCNSLVWALQAEAILEVKFSYHSFTFIFNSTIWFNKHHVN